MLVNIIMRYGYIVITQLVDSMGAYNYWFTLRTRYVFIVIIQLVTQYGHVY